MSKRIFILLALFLLTAIVCFYAINAGSYDITFAKVKNVLFNELFGISIDEISKMDKVIIYDIRFSRIVMAISAGFCLGVAGAVYQACFRNPLVEPFILGASSGAAFGAALAIVLANAYFKISVSAFAFSIFAVFLAYFLARSKENTPVVGLILSGVVIGSVFSALVSILKYISDDTGLREITFWIMGGLYHSNLKDATFIFVTGCVIFFVIFILSYRLNLLSLGDNEARTLGISPEINKILFITLATLLTSLSVSNVGIIAWIGLIMPHATRLLVGADNRWVIPISGLMGGCYLVLCDTIARTLTNAEIPVGIITSLLGSPFLLWLLRRNRKELVR